MITKEQLEKLNKDDLILYNELLEKDIKDVAYIACLEKHRGKILDSICIKKTHEIVALKQKLSRFIGYKNF